MAVTKIKSLITLLAEKPVRSMCCGCKKPFTTKYFKDGGTAHRSDKGNVICDTCMLKIQGIGDLRKLLQKLKDGGFTDVEIIKEVKNN